MTRRGRQCRHPQGDQGPRLYPHRGRQRDPLRLRRSRTATPRAPARTSPRRWSRQLGIEPDNIQWVVTNFSSLIPGLQANRFDMTAAEMAIRPERCQKVVYSEPNTSYGEGLLVADGDPKDIHTYSDFAKGGRQGRRHGRRRPAADDAGARRAGGQHRHHRRQRRRHLDRRHRPRRRLCRDRPDRQRARQARATRSSSPPTSSTR